MKYLLLYTIAFLLMFSVSCKGPGSSRKIVHHHKTGKVDAGCGCDGLGH